MVNMYPKVKWCTETKLHIHAPCMSLYWRTELLVPLFFCCSVVEHHTAAEEQGNRVMRQHVIVLQRQKSRLHLLELLSYSRSKEAFSYKHLSTIAFLHIFCRQSLWFIGKRNKQILKVGVPPTTVCLTITRCSSWGHESLCWLSDYDGDSAPNLQLTWLEVYWQTEISLL